MAARGAPWHTDMFFFGLGTALGVCSSRLHPSPNQQSSPVGPTDTSGNREAPTTSVGPPVEPVLVVPRALRSAPVGEGGGGCFRPPSSSQEKVRHHVPTSNLHSTRCLECLWHPSLQALGAIRTLGLLLTMFIGAIQNRFFQNATPPHYH